MRIKEIIGWNNRRCNEKKKKWTSLELANAMNHSRRATEKTFYATEIPQWQRGQSTIRDRVAVIHGKSSEKLLPINSKRANRHIFFSLFPHLFVARASVSFFPEIRSCALQLIPPFKCIQRDTETSCRFFNALFIVFFFFFYRSQHWVSSKCTVDHERFTGKEVF